MSRAIEVSEAEAAEVAAACADALAPSQAFDDDDDNATEGSQSTQPVFIPPLGERVEQLIRATDGADRDSILKGCEGETSDAVDQAIRQLLLAGHVYQDGNVLRSV